MTRLPHFPSQASLRFDAGFPIQHHHLYKPCAHHFEPVVVPLFFGTYSQVDRSTWRAGAPNGRERFGAVPQLAIEQELFSSPY